MLLTGSAFAYVGFVEPVLKYALIVVKLANAVASLRERATTRRAENDDAAEQTADGGP